MPILSLSFVAQRYRKSTPRNASFTCPINPCQQFSSTNPDTQRKNHALPPHYHLPPPTIPSTQPRHSHYPTAPFPLPNSTIPSTEPHKLFYGTMLSPPNFCPIPAKRYHRLCSPPSQFQRTCPLTPLHQCTHRSAPSRPFLPRWWSGCAMGTERLSHTNGSLLQCYPRGCTEVSEKSL